MRRFGMLMAASWLLTRTTTSMAETPEEIAAVLSRGNPQVTAILKAHPEILTVWREEFWADALLRSPTIPGTPWRSHDFRRPQPPVVRPELANCVGPKAPRGATILLDPAHAIGFGGEELKLWSYKDGVLTTSGRQSSRLASKMVFGDVRLHLEFREPSELPLGAWQYRGNSGVFLMGLYEIQILDSWQNPTYADGAMGALYGQHPPDVIASLPPGYWQCLDIDFWAPRFATPIAASQGDKSLAPAARVGAGHLLEPARATVWVNGIRVQNRAAFLGPTAFGELLPYTPHPREMAFTLQDHGDATSRVSFRNIWARRL